MHRYRSEARLARNERCGKVAAQGFGKKSAHQLPTNSIKATARTDDSTGQRLQAPNLHLVSDVSRFSPTGFHIDSANADIPTRCHPNGGILEHSNESLERTRRNPDRGIGIHDDVPAQLACG